ncbi:spindlin interactor and repressor of chromatin-binding protein-like [Polypterus senegalus]|uniref:spindlin interactor and repressor of chromatin-binding protein-like n=1 Tax=Polypterus senegalus TaxID=55291 RepID=UPI0019653F29|nr:spindlin interactor and repressor of chromatin-binding protein-like [Polypterus senegalus]
MEARNDIISLRLEDDEIGKLQYANTGIDGEDCFQKHNSSVYSDILSDPFTSECIPSTEDEWRNLFLMDYNPQTDLLVCMVCGGLQHLQSLESVKNHIIESHPHSLHLNAEERHRILITWDEQVSQRERFFLSQLQQGITLNSSEKSKNVPAEIEVFVEPEEQPGIKKHNTLKGNRRSMGRL